MCKRQLAGGRNAIERCQSVVDKPWRRKDVRASLAFISSKNNYWIDTRAEYSYFGCWMLVEFEIVYFDRFKWLRARARAKNTLTPKPTNLRRTENIKNVKFPCGLVLAIEIRFNFLYSPISSGHDRHSVQQWFSPSFYTRRPYCVNWPMDFQNYKVKWVSGEFRKLLDRLGFGVGHKYRPSIAKITNRQDVGRSHAIFLDIFIVIGHGFPHLLLSLVERKRERARA